MKLIVMFHSHEVHRFTSLVLMLREIPKTPPASELQLSAETRQQLDIRPDKRQTLRLPR